MQKGHVGFFWGRGLFFIFFLSLFIYFFYFFFVLFFWSWWAQINTWLAKSSWRVIFTLSIIHGDHEWWGGPHLQYSFAWIIYNFWSINTNIWQGWKGSSLCFEKISRREWRRISVEWCQCRISVEWRQCLMASVLWNGVSVEWRQCFLREASPFWLCTETVSFPWCNFCAKDLLSPVLVESKRHSVVFSTN